jgi:hypothetical protein
MLLDRNPIRIKEPIKTHLKIAHDQLFHNGLRKKIPPLPPPPSFCETVKLRSPAELAPELSLRRREESLLSRRSHRQSGSRRRPAS